MDNRIKRKFELNVNPDENYSPVKPEAQLQKEYKIRQELIQHEIPMRITDADLEALNN